VEQPTLHRLEGISPRAFQHPADRAATAALAQIPGVDQVVRKLTELKYERALRQMLLANAVKIGPQQLPELWTVYERAGETLDMLALPDLYTTYLGSPNAMAIGVDGRSSSSRRSSSSFSTRTRCGPSPDTSSGTCSRITSSTRRRSRSCSNSRVCSPS
jgi:hypothetical protein